MAQHFDTPIVCPTLIGRSAERAALLRCFDEAAGGRGRTVFVAGEAGIGKSRLVAEAVRHAEERGARALVGRCGEPDRTLSLQPLFDLFQRSLRQWPQIAGAALVDAASDLAPILPDLGRLLPNLVPAATLGPEQDRRRAVRALARFVEIMAVNAPLLLAIEDAHWSDDATIEALFHLATAVADGWPVLLLVTYRDDERGPDLDGLLDRLNRRRLAATIRLDPLSKEEVGSMLAAMGAPRRLPSWLGQEIADLAEGNPFFVEELLRSALTDDGLRPGALPLPDRIDDVVRLRAQRLDAGARQTLVHAAVIGRRFDVALLQEIGLCDGDEMLRRVKALIDAGLVVETAESDPAASPEEIFTFRHALTRQGIYKGLLALERRRLHRTIFDAMRRRYGTESDSGRHAVDLASHAFAAGAWEDALVWGERAGAQALVFHAPRAAAEHFSHAITAAAALGEVATPLLYHLRGRAFETLGDFAAARADFERAVELARAAADRTAEAEGLLALGELWEARNYQIAGGRFETARAVAEAADDRATLARCLNRLGNWRVNLGQCAEAFRDHQAALAIFQDLGDERGAAETLDLLGIARFLAADMMGSVAAYRQAIDLLRGLNDRQTLCNALAVFSLSISSPYMRVVAPPLADSREGRRHADESLAIARDIGWLPGEAFALCCVARCYGTSLAPALAAARQALRIAEEVGHVQWQTFAHDAIGRLLTTLLDFDAAQAHLERARSRADAIGSAHWQAVTAADLASVFIERGELRQASEALAAILDEAAPLANLGQRYVWLTRADLASAEGDWPTALAIVDRLLRVALGDPDPDSAQTPYLAFVRGQALAGLDRLEEATGAFRAARDGAISLEFPSLRWRVQLALAALARRRGDRVEAAREEAAAHETVEWLAVEIDDDDTRARFVRNALARFPRGRPLTPRQTAKAAFGGLTERELAVAALIAAGRKNREIAADLFIQERTAATHVANILGKLGLSSRAQIASWATEHGLSSARES
ncbi:MAG TPA: AAA family ATPase [Thermomicrobiales bacterium]|nr:AAA family ATPase [Thermomicrobiales bacterium]